MLELNDTPVFGFNVKFNVVVGPLTQDGRFNATTEDIEEAKAKFIEYMNREMKVFSLEILEFSPVVEPTAPATTSVN